MYKRQVDNCYGEFTELAEPTMLGADLAAGSLIKNPGGGLSLIHIYMCIRDSRWPGCSTARGFMFL